jgi:hypothetical protein
MQKLIQHFLQNEGELGNPFCPALCHIILSAAESANFDVNSPITCKLWDPTHMCQSMPEQRTYFNMVLGAMTTDRCTYIQLFELMANLGANIKIIAFVNSTYSLHVNIELLSDKEKTELLHPYLIWILQKLSSAAKCQTLDKWRHLIKLLSYLLKYLPWRSALILKKCICAYYKISNAPELNSAMALESALNITEKPQHLLCTCRMTIRESIQWKMDNVWMLPLPEALKGYLRGTDYAIEGEFLP